MKKKKQKRAVRKFKKKNKHEIFYSLLGYFLGIFLVNFASKGLEIKYLLNPIQAIEFLAEQVTIITGLPPIITIPVGLLLTLVPLAFVYVLVRGDW